VNETYPVACVAAILIVVVGRYVVTRLVGDRYRSPQRVRVQLHGPRRGRQPAAPARLAAGDGPGRSAATGAAGATTA